MFAEEFQFNKQEYREYLRHRGEIVGGFMQQKGLDNPALQLTGHLQPEHSEHQQQVVAYKEWLEESIKITGKLSLPTTDNVNLLADKPLNKKSRVAEALAKMPKKKKEATPPKVKPQKKKQNIAELMQAYDSDEPEQPSIQYQERVE